MFSEHSKFLHPCEPFVPTPSATVVCLSLDSMVGLWHASFLFRTYTKKQLEWVYIVYIEVLCQTLGLQISSPNM